MATPGYEQSDLLVKEGFENDDLVAGFDEPHECT